jgi:hypothetical protein
MSQREKLDPYWHMARIAARIWLKDQQGKPLSPRDKRLARKLAETKGVTNRLIEQARTYWTAPYTLDENLNWKPRARRVVVPKH